MKILQIILVIGMLVVVGACNTEQTAPTLDNLSIVLTVEPDPPVAGEAMLMFWVKDADGTLIHDAVVSVHGDMDHEGMTPVDVESVSGQNGIYHVPFEWTMGGGWILDVTVTLPDNTGIATERFELNVGAISRDSIVNQGNDDTAAMDHSAMDDMDTEDTSDINIHYMPDNDPALAGDANVVVMLTSFDGQPINDANIALHATMPEYDMMPVDSTGDEGIKGRYTIPVRWTMAGEWSVEITVMLSDTQEITQTYTQQVLMPDDTDDEMADMSDHENSD